MSAACRKIVVVEDDSAIRGLETLLLNSEGFEVVEVASGRQVAETVKREAAGLVLLDLMLPEKNGNSVLQELQSEPATAQVPVIVVSAFPGQLRRTPQVRRVVPKPFEIADLLDAVSQVFESPRAH